MELRQLRYFLAVAEEENISAAARRLNLSQPALSRQIKALENDLGWELLERGKKSVGLTEAGLVVVEEGKKILARVDLGLDRMKREIEGVVLRIGYSPSLSSGLLGRALECFTQLHTQIRVELLDLNSIEMDRGLDEETVDLVVGAGSESEYDVSWIPLCEYCWRVAMGQHHPLAEKELLSAGDLNGERLLLYCRSDYPGYWQDVTTYFKAHEIDAKVAGEFDGITSLTAAIEAGLGMALVAETTRFGASDKVVTRAVFPEPEPLIVGVRFSSKREPNKWTHAFIDELKRAAQT